MKKKTKVISAVLALCLSVSMLAVGVLAASTVTLNVTSSVTFKSTGAYVMATGQVKRGTEGSLTNLTEDDRPETDTTSGASYSYTGYSYTPIGSGSDANAPDGTAPKNLEDWTIGEIEFLDTAPVIQYSISFKNYGESEVEINITGMPDEITNVEIQGTTLPITVASGQTEEYTLTLTLTKFNESIDPAVQVNLNTSMVSKSAISESDTFTCTYEVVEDLENPTGADAIVAYLFVNDVCVLSLNSYYQDIGKTGTLILEPNSSIYFAVNSDGLTTRAGARGWGSYKCEVFDDSNEKVAEAYCNYDSGNYSVTGEVGLPYIVKSDIKIIFTAQG